MGRVSLCLVIMFFICSVQKIDAQVQNIRGKQDTISATKSLEHIRSENIKEGPLNNALDVLSGQLAGVSVTTNGTSRLAMLNSIHVRGITSIMNDSDPLVVIDGVTSDIVMPSAIYPTDVESSTILKNTTETAMYGSRDASGIIGVKTKKGTGRGFEISYDSNYGFESMYKYLQIFNGSEYIVIAEALGSDYSNNGYDTNSHDVITRASLMHQHHLTFSGDSENSNCRASFGSMDHNTIVRVNDYRNLMAKLNATQKAFDSCSVDDFSVYGYSSKVYDIFDTRMLFCSAAAQNPTYPAGTGVNGNQVKNSAASYINHPGALLYGKNDSEEWSFNTHLGLESNTLDNLISSTFSSYSHSSTGNAQFCPTQIWAQGSVYRGEFKGEDYSTNTSLSYNNVRGGSHLDTVAGTECLRQVRTGLWVQAKGMITDGFSYSNIGATSPCPFGDTNSSYEGQSLASIMGSVTYSYRDGYSTAAALRGDGSSMIGDSSAFEFSPSVSLGWDAKREGSLSDTDFITTLKLRTGYGWLGNLGGITSYTTLDTIERSGIVSISGAPIITMGSIHNTNPDLKWETRSTFNIGFDLGIRDNQLILTSGLYYPRTTDMLYEYDVPIPVSMFGKPMANIGSMSNQGIELGTSVVSIQRKDMEMNINFSMSYQKDKLLPFSGECNGMYMTVLDITPIDSLYGASQNGGGNNVIYRIVGQPLGVFYLPHCEGLKENELGGYSYDIEDLDGDGEIDFSDGGDRYITDQATPKVTIGSNVSFRYKSFDIATQINGAFGHKIFSGMGLVYINMSIFPGYNVLKDVPGENTIDQNVSGYRLGEGDYINIEYITIGYNIPVRFKAVKSLCLSAGASNLVIITGYGGLTPTISSYVVSNILGINDKRTYPLYRTYLLGLNIQF